MSRACPDPCHWECGCVAEGTVPTVEVRIAVAVAPTGRWFTTGATTLPKAGEHIVTVTARVPLPPPILTVKGDVNV